MHQNNPRHYIFVSVGLWMDYWMGLQVQNDQKEMKNNQKDTQN